MSSGSSVSRPDPVIPATPTTSPACTCRSTPWTIGPVQIDERRPGPRRRLAGPRHCDPARSCGRSSARSGGRGRVESTRSVATLSPVAEHRHLVGDLEHLVEVVRDVEDRDAAFLQAPDRLEHVLDVAAPGSDAVGSSSTSRWASCSHPSSARARATPVFCEGPEHRPESCTSTSSKPIAASARRALATSACQLIVPNLVVKPSPSARFSTAAQRLDEAEVLVHEPDARRARRRARRRVPAARRPGRCRSTSPRRSSPVGW